MKLALVFMDEGTKKVYYTEPIANITERYIDKYIDSFNRGVKDSVNDIVRDENLRIKFAQISDYDLVAECRRRGL